MEREEVHRRRWWILGILCLSVVIVALDNLILNVALPIIQRELDASSSELQWTVDAYSLVFAALLFTSGGLGDRYGRKLALTIGLVLFGGASLVTAFSTSTEMLIAFRAVMGVGRRSSCPLLWRSSITSFPHRSGARPSGSGPGRRGSPSRWGR